MWALNPSIWEIWNRKERERKDNVRDMVPKI